MSALDVLGQRWALRVIWELRSERCLTFRALQEATGGVSPNVLNRRLAELRDANVICHDGGYKLTENGTALFSALGPLVAWAESQ